MVIIDSRSLGFLEYHYQIQWLIFVWFDVQGIYFNQSFDIYERKRKKKSISNIIKCVYVRLPAYILLSNMKLLLLKLTYFGFSSNSLFVLALYFPCNMRKIKNRNHKTIRQHVKYMLMYTKTHGKHGCGGLKSINRALFFLVTYLWAILFFFLRLCYQFMYCWLLFPFCYC